MGYDHRHLAAVTLLLLFGTSSMSAKSRGFDEYTLKGFDLGRAMDPQRMGSIRRWPWKPV
jgi:hypothetical protein